MSTVVYFVEFTMLSLLGFMIFRLYTSYVGWKKSSTYSLPKSNLKPDPMVGRNFDYQLGNERLDYLAVKNIYVTEEKDKNFEAKNDKNSSAILNDYIGEFFSESMPVDIEHFRSQPSVKGSKASVSKPYSTQESDETLEHYYTISSFNGVLNENSRVIESTENIASNSKTQDDEIILVSSSKVQNNGAESQKAKESSSFNEAMIPTLRELNDIDADSIITVDDLSDEQTKNNKVMSDKVVLAMLDEAKLVCAS